MPQLAPGFGRTVNNGGDGTAQLNLRGLGAGRTLVLLNGRRIAPSGLGSAIDVNNLPRALLERVEIITWNPDGTPRAWDSRKDYYNFAPINYPQTPLTQISLGLMGVYDVSY